MHGADAARLSVALEAEVEVGASMPMKRPGSTSSRRLRKRLRSDSRRGRWRSTSLRPITASARGVASVHPLLAHRGAADAGELGIGAAFAQPFDQPGAEQVAGRLAGAQRDAPGRIVHRNSGRSPRSMKSRKARTSSLPLARSASCALASSSFAPDM